LIFQGFLSRWPYTFATRIHRIKGVFGKLAQFLHRNNVRSTAFLTDKHELKPGLVIFRRTDVRHRNWYCRVRVPKSDRYKTTSLKTADLAPGATEVYFHSDREAALFANGTGPDKLGYSHRLCLNAPDAQEQINADMARFDDTRA
jgi:hypothetical protein